MPKKVCKLFVLFLLTAFIGISGCTPTIIQETGTQPEPRLELDTYSSNIPEFSGDPYVILDDNEPAFPESAYSNESFETYSELDELNRCGTAYANIGPELMPTKEREAIGQIKPSGWHSVKYDSVDGKYLYNRCHLIGFQLAGENANEKNLITGTRYLNVDGMLPFEDMTADYIRETGNHVLYRVTPIYNGDNLVASGVEMEALSMEDQGEGIRFHVYVYNNQPGIQIDYATGDSWLATESTTPERIGEDSTAAVAEYILNTNTKKFHTPACASAKDMKPSNKAVYRGMRDELIEQGYDACSRCKP